MNGGGSGAPPLLLVLLDRFAGGALWIVGRIVDVALHICFGRGWPSGGLIKREELPEVRDKPPLGDTCFESGPQ